MNSLFLLIVACLSSSVFVTANALDSSPSFAKPFNSIANTYSNNLQKRYYPTQAITMAGFCALSDCVRQKRGGLSDTIDLEQTGKASLHGIAGGLIWGAWFPLAERWSANLATRTLDILSISSSGRSMAVLKTFYSILMEQVIVRGLIRAGVDGTRFFPGMDGDWRTVVKTVIYNLQLNMRVFGLGIFQVLSPFLGKLNRGGVNNF